MEAGTEAGETPTKTVGLEVFRQLITDAARAHGCRPHQVEALSRLGPGYYALGCYSPGPDDLGCPMYAADLIRPAMQEKSTMLRDHVPEYLHQTAFAIDRAFAHAWRLHVIP